MKLKSSTAFPSVKTGRQTKNRTPAGIRTAGASFLFPLSLFVGIFSGLTFLVLYNPFQIGGKDVSLRA